MMKPYISMILAFTLSVPSLLCAEKITDATNHRLQHFFNSLGEKTNWYFALELGDDDQKAQELANKLESIKIASIASGQIWDQERLVQLLSNLYVFSFRIDSTQRCIDLQYNLPILDRTSVGDIQDSFCDNVICDADLLVAQLPDHLELNKLRLKMDAKAKDYLAILEDRASFKYRIVSLSGRSSALSNPNTRVVSNGPTVFEFLNSFSLTQKHSYLLYMAYVIHGQEHRLDIYIGN